LVSRVQQARRRNDGRGLGPRRVVSRTFRGIKDDPSVIEYDGTMTDRAR
jgi:hypothetical protein